jgi:hypothetical protein
MIAKKFILLGLLLASGCATEPPRYTVIRGTAHQGEATTNPKDWVNKATDMSEDLKRQVVEGKLELPEAIRIEKERRAERDRQVQSSLDRIKKESREEYAATRPAKIKNCILKEELCIGMDDRDVLVCLGQPERKSRIVTRSGLRENWLYSKLSVWFEDGAVMGWQQEE